MNYFANVDAKISYDGEFCRNCQFCNVSDHVCHLFEDTLEYSLDGLYIFRCKECVKRTTND